MIARWRDGGGHTRARRAAARPVGRSQGLGRQSGGHIDPPRVAGPLPRSIERGVAAARVGYSFRLKSEPKERGHFRGRHAVEREALQINGIGFPE